MTQLKGHVQRSITDYLLSKQSAEDYGIYKLKKAGSALHFIFQPFLLCGFYVALGLPSWANILGVFECQGRIFFQSWLFIIFLITNEAKFQGTKRLGDTEEVSVYSLFSMQNNIQYSNLVRFMFHFSYDFADMDSCLPLRRVVWFVFPTAGNLSQIREEFCFF